MLTPKGWGEEESVNAEAEDENGVELATGSPYDLADRVT